MRKIKNSLKPFLNSLLLMALVLIALPSHAGAACAPLPTDKGQATFTVSVTKTGTYRVWSRIYVPDSTNNSFLMQVDNSNCAISVGGNSATGLSWVDYRDGRTNNFIDITLSAGNHTFTIAGNETSVGVDTILVSSNPACVPSGNGGNCANTGGSSGGGQTSGSGSGSTKSSGSKGNSGSSGAASHSSSSSGASTSSSGSTSSSTQSASGGSTASGTSSPQPLVVPTSKHNFYNWLRLLWIPAVAVALIFAWLVVRRAIINRHKPVPHNLDLAQELASPINQTIANQVVVGDVEQMPTSIKPAWGSAAVIVFALFGVWTIFSSFANDNSGLVQLSQVTPSGNAKVVPLAGSSNGSVLQFGPVFLPTNAAAAVTNSFNSNPNWIGVANTPAPACVPINLNFGYSANTNFAGSAPGEVGGTLHRALNPVAYYAKPLNKDTTLKDTLTASGMMDVESNDSAIVFGWFNTGTSRFWRTNDSLIFHFHSISQKYDDVGSDYAITPELTSHNYLATGIARQSAHYHLLFHHKYPWSMTYNPSDSTLDVTINGLETKQVMSQPVIDDGATFNSFGILNHQFRTGGSTSVAYFDDINVGINGQPVTAPGGDTFTGSNDGWVGQNNVGNFQDCQADGGPTAHTQNLGFQNSNNTGAGHGEIGGVAWRAGGTKYGAKATSYAAPVSNLSSNNILYATGKIRVTLALTDADTYFGWFNSQSSFVFHPDPSPSNNYYSIGKNAAIVHIGGSTRYGYPFTAYYSNGAADPNTGAGVTVKDNSPTHGPWPQTNPTGRTRDFFMCYIPNSDGAGAGTMTVGLSADPTNNLPAAISQINISSKIAASPAIFDRFGLVEAGPGGNAIGYFIKDLQYTSAPGDGGIPNQCMNRPAQQPQQQTNVLNLLAPVDEDSSP